MNFHIDMPESGYILWETIKNLNETLDTLFLRSNFKIISIKI